MSLVVIGANHNTAPLSMRERLSVSDVELADVLDNAGSLGFHIVHDVLIVYYRSESCNLCILFKLVIYHLYGSVNSKTESG